MYILSWCQRVELAVVANQYLLVVQAQAYGMASAEKFQLLIFFKRIHFVQLSTFNSNAVLTVVQEHS